MSPEGGSRPGCRLLQQPFSSHLVLLPKMPSSVDEPAGYSSPPPHSSATSQACEPVQANGTCRGGQPDILGEDFLPGGCRAGDVPFCQIGLAILPSWGTKATAQACECQSSRQLGTSRERGGMGQRAGTGQKEGHGPKAGNPMSCQHQGSLGRERGKREPLGW